MTDKSLLPCSWYTNHAPAPTSTELHHLHPVYLQMELWGELRLPATRPTCGTCHNGIHDWINHYLRGWRRPVGSADTRLAREAQRVVVWFSTELDKQAPRHQQVTGR